MLLDICEDNWLFIINHTKYIDFFFYFIIVVCIFLCFLIKKKQLLERENSPIILKLFLFIFSILILSFLISVFTNTLNSDKFEGCFCKFTFFNSLKEKEPFKTGFSKIGNNKVIIVGDSRMELIEDYLGEYDIPINYSFIAKSGARVEWFEDEAILELYKILNNKDTSFKYHVVINMGVNDVNYESDFIDRAYRYINIYRDLSLKYPKVKFYFLSVNPTKKSLLKIYWSTIKKQNVDIEKFNGIIVSGIKNLTNFKYCDSFHNMSFKTYDGLHYTDETNQDIIDYIANKCVEYEYQA